MWCVDLFVYVLLDVYAHLGVFVYAGWILYIVFMGCVDYF